MAVESVPASPLFGRLSPTTRGGFLPWLHATPSQLQKAVLPFHEARVLPGLASSLKATRAASSSSLLDVRAMTSRSKHNKPVPRSGIAMSCNP
jgi:hypothetical protein